jgi:hypothetical protein
VEAADAFVGGREEGRHGKHLVISSDSAIGRGRKSNMAEWYVLCWIGTFVNAGYNMFPRSMGGESVCKKKSRVLQIQSSTRGSGTYNWHLEKHDAASQTGVGGGTEADGATASAGILVKLAAPMKQRMADAAVVGVCLDHQSYGFSTTRGVLAIVAAAVKAAAGYGPATIFDVGNYLLCATTVAHATVCTAAAHRRAGMDPDGVVALASIRGGGASTDGWKCARTGRKFYDLNISCLEVFVSVGFGQATIHLSNRCTVFANHDSKSESLDSIIATIEHATAHCLPGITFRALLAVVTLVTDWVAVMPNIASRSVSAAVSPLDERWLECSAHQLDTVLKNILPLQETTEAQKSRQKTPALVPLFADLASVQLIVRTMKLADLADLNGKFEKSCRVMQLSEARFHSVTDVAARFVKSFDKVENCLAEGSPQNAAMTAMATMCVVKGVPVLVEVVARVFAVLKKAIVAMQYSNNPTLHMYLPTRAILLAELEALRADAMSRKSQVDIYGLMSLSSDNENLVFGKENMVAVTRLRFRF